MSAEQSREYQFNLTIDGDLDRGEMKVRRNLMHEIKGVLKEFAKADYADAIEKFSELKLNTEYLTNVAMDLSSTRSIAVAGLYAAAAMTLPVESAPAPIRVISDPAPSTPRSESTGVAIRLTAAVLDLQAELFPAESDADAGTNVKIEGDFYDDSAAQSGVKTASIDDTQNAMKTLLQEFMGELDNRQEKDKPERHGESDDQGDQSDSKPERDDG